jgi:hypothetical protein
MKKLVLKDIYTIILIGLLVGLVLVNIMLLSELVECYLFYSVSINIMLVLGLIIKRFASVRIKNMFFEEE